jgi:hypothetical protein
MTYGQSLKTDSTPINNTIAYFNKSIGEQSRFFNGIEYTPANPIITGNPFFPDTKDYHVATLMYDNVYYADIPVLYDISKDLLVAVLYNKFSRFTLISEKVKFFDLANHHFVRINADSTGEKTLLQTGFYDELYVSPKVRLLVKRTKSSQTFSGNVTVIVTSFVPKTEYYLKVNNAYFTFSGQNSMLSILKDKRKEIKQFLKANQIRFKDDPEQSMIKIANFYDHLAN